MGLKGIEQQAVQGLPKRHGTGGNSCHKGGHLAQQVGRRGPLKIGLGGDGKQHGAGHAQQNGDQDDSIGGQGRNSQRQSQGHGEQQQGGAQQKPPGPADIRAAEHQPREKPAHDGAQAEGGLGKAVVQGGQAQADFHQIGQAHHQQGGEEEVEQGHQGQHPQQAGLLPGQESARVPEIPPQGGQRRAGEGSSLEGDAEKELHHSRAEEAGPAHRHHGEQAYPAVEHTAQDGAQQIGQGLYLGHHAVGGGQVLLRRQGGYAGLHRGLVEGLNGCQEHHQHPDGQNRAPAGKEQAVPQHQGGGEEVQPPHDALPGDAVGQDAPQGGAEDGGHHGHGQDAAEGGGGAGGVQHIEGQGEAEDGVAEQGDDLARDHEGEVAGKQAVRAHRAAPFGRRARRLSGASGAERRRRGPPGPGRGEAMFSS